MGSEMCIRDRQERSFPPGSPPPSDDETDNGELSVDIGNLTVMCFLSQEMIHVSSVEEMADQLVSDSVKIPSPLCLDILISLRFEEASIKLRFCRVFRTPTVISRNKMTDPNFYRRKRLTRPSMRSIWYGG